MALWKHLTDVPTPLIENHTRMEEAIITTTITNTIAHLRKHQAVLPEMDQSVAMTSSPSN